MRKFNHKLVSAIKESGWRNRDVLFACGIGVTRFSRIIAGIYEPTQEERQKISKFLRTAQKDIFN